VSEQFRSWPHGALQLQGILGPPDSMEGAACVAVSVKPQCNIADRADVSWEVRFVCLDAEGESVAEVTEPLTVHAAVPQSVPIIELWVSTVQLACVLKFD